MRLLIACALLVSFWVLSGVAQQPAPPLSPQEQLDRVRLELVYADREHQMCRQSLSDIWARGNTLEAQMKQLQDEKQKLADELKALKEPTSAAPTN